MAEAERRQVALNALVEWSRKEHKDFFLRADCVRAVVDKTAAVRMVATADIAPQTLLVNVPVAMAFTPESATHAERLKPCDKLLQKGIVALVGSPTVDDLIGIGKGSLATRDVAG
jgi:hypothetical protein